MQSPIFDMITKYKSHGRAPFHTPGHKGHSEVLNALNILSHDLTELADTCCLYGTNETPDAIEQSERLASDTFGSQLTLFSAGGCTLCIQTMLLLSAGKGGGRMLFARNSHFSAVHAAALLGLEPIWIWPDGDSMQISCNNVASALAINPDAVAVYITSPDYYGNIADIAKIATLCHGFGIPLLVDNAHGSHLGAFGMHPLSLGADMTCDSCHKTLPVLTGGAMLHIGHSEFFRGIDRPTAKSAMMMFGSTSPSFLILASLDLARDWWQKEGLNAYIKTAQSVEELARAAHKHDIGVLKSKLHDPARLTLDTGSCGVDGIAAAAYFGERGCEPEHSDSRFVVFIITPFNTADELDRLRDAIAEFPSAFKRDGITKHSLDSPFFAGGCEHPAAALTPREALMSPSETVDVQSAVGRVAARAICPCPPGIALIVPGEVIDDYTAQKLKSYRFDRPVVVKTL